MTRSLVFLAALSLVETGFGGCGADRERDAGAPDVTTDGDVMPDVDGDGPTPDGAADAGTDADTEHDDADGLPPPVAMELVEVPHDRLGLDCGPGCQQLTFAEEAILYEVGESYLLYSVSGPGYRAPLYLVSLETLQEYKMDPCEEYWCGSPGIDGSTVVYPTARWAEDPPLMTVWRYHIGDPSRFALVERQMTEYTMPLGAVYIHGDLIAWVDSAIPLVGVYVMDINEREVIDITPSIHCPCYGEPRLFGREVIFDYFGPGSGYSNMDILRVNVDTLEQENLTSSMDVPSAQFDPAFDGQWVVWTDGRNDPSYDPYGERVNPDIYGMELATRVVEPLCDHPAVQLYPDVRDGLVAWDDLRNAEDPNDNRYTANWDIYLLDLDTRREVQVTSLPGSERGAQIWGRRVFFYSTDLIGQGAIFMVDLDEAGLL